MIVHNLFGFDMSFFIKGYCATAWGTKYLNFDGTNLTHISYVNIAGEIKFIAHLNIIKKV